MAALMILVVGWVLVYLVLGVVLVVLCLAGALVLFPVVFASVWGWYNTTLCGLVCFGSSGLVGDCG